MGAICLRTEGCNKCPFQKQDIERPDRKICGAKPNQLGFVGRDDLSIIEQYHLYEKMRKK